VKIAVLGASGHVGKTLLHEFASNTDIELHSFVRNTSKIISDRWLPAAAQKNVFNINLFPAAEYDAVINCIGIGNTREIQEHPLDLFMLTEKYDNLVLSYLAEHTSCVAVNISSGAVYGTAFSSPASADKSTVFHMNNISGTDFYSMIKAYSEVKHRASPQYKIVDVRLFSYFSAYLDLETNYFMSDLVNSIMNHQKFSTNRENFIRDFIHPSDFAQLILAAIRNGANTAVDAYSLSPISKYEILKFAENNYGVDIQYTGGFVSVTGEKSQYFSLYRMEDNIDYSPRYTSEETISEELKKILERRINGKS